jgi:hypothetical protein
MDQVLETRSVDEEYIISLVPADLVEGRLGLGDVEKTGRIGAYPVLHFEGVMMKGPSPIQREGTRIRFMKLDQRYGKHVDLCTEPSDERSVGSWR